MSTRPRQSLNADDVALLDSFESLCHLLFLDLDERLLLRQHEVSLVVQLVLKELLFLDTLVQVAPTT